MTSSVKIGRMNGFLEILEEQQIPDGFGGASGVDMVLIAKVRCIHKLKSKTAQARIEGGAFDFYQVHEFLVRKSPNYTIRKDMELHFKNEVYVIRGIAPHDSNPDYITITTEKR